jgi:hypothetical protein
MAARKVGRLLAHHVQAGKRERGGSRPVPGLEHGNSPASPACCWVKPRPAGRAVCQPSWLPDGLLNPLRGRPYRVPCHHDQGAGTNQPDQPGSRLPKTTTAETRHDAIMVLRLGREMPAMAAPTGATGKLSWRPPSGAGVTVPPVTLCRKARGWWRNTKPNCLRCVTRSARQLPKAASTWTTGISALPEARAAASARDGCQSRLRSGLNVNGTVPRRLATRSLTCLSRSHRRALLNIGTPVRIRVHGIALAMACQHAFVPAHALPRRADA